MRVKINQDGTIKLSEHEEQAGIFQWAEAKSRECPELAWLFAVPNGTFYGNEMTTIRGKPVPRRLLQAQRMRREGLKTGVPDMILPIPRKPYHALFIELKVKPNKPSEEQMAWLNFLNAQNYRAEWCYGQDRAKEIICEYLGIQNREFII